MQCHSESTIISEQVIGIRKGEGLYPFMSYQKKGSPHWESKRVCVNFFFPKLFFFMNNRIKIIRWCTGLIQSFIGFYKPKAALLAGLTLFCYVKLANNIIPHRNNFLIIPDQKGLILRLCCALSLISLYFFCPIRVLFKELKNCHCQRFIG